MPDRKAVTTDVTRTPKSMTKRRGRNEGFDSPFISAHSQGRLLPRGRRAGCVPRISLHRSVHCRRSVMARYHDHCVHNTTRPGDGFVPCNGIQTVRSVPRLKRNGRFILADSRGAVNDSWPCLLVMVSAVG